MKKILNQVISRSDSLSRLARQYVACKPYSRASERLFVQFYNYLNEVQHCERRVLEEIQFGKVLELLFFAYRNSGFYQEYYNRHGIGEKEIKGIQSLDDFRKVIPIVSKNELRNATHLTVPHIGMTPQVTSGTTGSPFQFYIDPEGLALERAAILHQWSRAGFRVGDTRIEMRGLEKKIIGKHSDLNLYRFSITKMNDHFGEMVSFMNKRRIPYLHGYPSAIAKFAMLARATGMKPDHPIRGVFLASEMVYDWQLEVIKEVLEPRSIIAHYGSAETVALGAYCEEREAYHFIPVYGYLECGDAGEVIATGFINRATPFIRYRMSDVLQGISEGPCERCHRGYFPIVEKIAGRLEDYLVDEKGELIPPAVITFPFKNLQAITSVRIHQTKTRDLLIECVVSPKYRGAFEGEKHFLEKKFRFLLGDGIRVEFKKVEEIALTDQCKFKWITSDASASLVNIPIEKSGR